MELSYMIVEVLKRHSSEKNTLNQTQLLRRLQDDYPHLAKEITEKKVRSALEKMTAQEIALPEEARALRYTDAKRKKQYWTGNSLSDVELKFLIDSVVYSNIIGTQNARSLAKRIQGLSGKRLRELTPYASGAFGEQKYTAGIDVLKNVEAIAAAQEEGRKIRFNLNVFSVQNRKIELRPTKEHTVSPLETVLHSGRYYLLACYDNDRIYSFRVDLMTDIRQTADPARRDVPALKNFRRDAFVLQHPVMYTGRVRRFTLRVSKDSLTQIVDSFSNAVTVVPGGETEDTVDLWVDASDGAMKYWLLRYGDIVEAVNMPEDFAAELKNSVELLAKNICEILVSPYMGDTFCYITKVQGQKNGEDALRMRDRSGRNVTYTTTQRGTPGRCFSRQWVV